MLASDPNARISSATVLAHWQEMLVIEGPVEVRAGEFNNLCESLRLCLALGR
jgi:hypothetical protein